MKELYLICTWDLLTGTESGEAAEYVAELVAPEAAHQKIMSFFLEYKDTLFEY